MRLSSLADSIAAPNPYTGIAEMLTEDYELQLTSDCIISQQTGYAIV